MNLLFVAVSVAMAIALGMSYFVKLIAFPALKSGVLQARGRTYTKQFEPRRFWFGIVFWFLMTSFMWTAVLVLAAMILSGA